MTSRPLIAVLTPLFLLVATSREAVAQTCEAQGSAGTCSVNATTSLTLPSLPVRLTVGSATTAFGTVTSADFDQGFALVNGPSVTVKANSPWSVQISSASTFWTATNTDPGTPARTDKPRADLRWASAFDADGSSYAAVTGTAVEIGNGAGTAGTVVPLYFLSVWSYALDTPGNYSISVTLTLVRP